MTSRRDAVKTLAALAAAGLLPRSARATPWSAAPWGATSIERIGVQLYTVRAAMRADPVATLRALAQIGFREVEWWGQFGKSPAEIRLLLDDNGLVSPSWHVGLEAVQGGFDATAEAAHVMGQTYVTVASLDTRTIKTIDDWKRVADAFNEAGRRVRAAGLRFAYHNHDYEFTAIDGQVPMDILYAGTDPALVAHEMDVYWVTAAGRDPLRYFTRFPGRFEMVHVKDSKGPPANTMTEVGSGTIDWKELFAQRAVAGIKHYFVEHDEPADPMASIRVSHDYLKALRF